VDGQLSPMELCAYPDAKPPDHFPKHILGFEPQHDALLDFVAEGSTGWEAGLRQGDRIVAVGSTSVQSWYGAWLEASWEHEEAAPVALTVQRGERTFEVTVPQGTIPDWGLGMAALPSLGLASRSPDQLVVGAMGAGAPEGLRSGDVVVSVTGRIPAAQMTDDMEALPESDRLGELRLRRGELACELRAASGAPQAGSALPPEARAQLEGELASVAEELAALESPFAQAEQPGGDSPASRSWSMEDPAWGTLLALANSVVEPRIEVEVLRDGKRHTLTAVLQERSEQPTIGYLGVAPLKRERLVKSGPVEAIGPTLQAPFKILRDFVAGIRAMLNRRASAKMLAGPVGILQATYSYAEKSTGDLANFLALLSVNLAVVNFLPIPITDGGHFVFLMYEKVKGRRMDEELEARFQWAGLVFILLVFLFATFNDVGRIFGF